MEDGGGLDPQTLSRPHSLAGKPRPCLVHHPMTGTAPVGAYAARLKPPRTPWSAAYDAANASGFTLTGNPVTPAT